ncbi:MAG: transposase [Patescibacteria group bacterium]
MDFAARFRLGSKRLQNWDYAADGFYFVTICTQNRENLFGEIRNGKMVLNELGKIVAKFWREIPVHFANTKLDAFVVMPNHFHGILVIDNFSYSQNAETYQISGKNVETLHATFLQKTTVHPKTTENYFSKISPKPKSVPTIIRSFKSATTKQIHCIHPALDRIWQTRFHDRVIRDEDELNRIREYIWQNPENWEKDEENLRKI